MNDHSYSPTCGCPGCQFLWAAEQQYLKHGAPPVIGTFEPRTGDVGRDCDSPVAQYRTWVGGQWYPLYEVVPKQTQEEADRKYATISGRHPN